MKGKAWGAVAAALLAMSMLAAQAGGQEVDRVAGPTVERDGPVRGAHKSWCHGGSGGRGTCTAIFRRQGRFLFVWATTQQSVKKYKLCVRSPKGDRRCKRFRTRNLSDETVGDVVFFGRHFPHNADGRYSVSWRANGKQVGPELHFEYR